MPRPAIFRTLPEYFVRTITGTEYVSFLDKSMRPRRGSFRFRCIIAARGLQRRGYGKEARSCLVRLSERNEWWGRRDKRYELHLVAGANGFSGFFCGLPFFLT
jgi:hypothetical protein